MLARLVRVTGDTSAFRFSPMRSRMPAAKMVEFSIIAAARVRITPLAGFPT